MAVSNDLFELIKSLSKSEKRYFRIQASLNSRGGTNKYVQLFDLIDAQQTYDEQQVRAAFARKFSARHFAEAKYYLYNAILRALHLYDAEQSIDVRMFMTLHQAAILFHRNLFRQGEKLVARAREMAVENERWDLAVEAQHLEFRIEMQKGSPVHQIDKLLDGVLAYSELWKDREEQWAINSRIVTHLTATGRPRNSEQLGSLYALLEKYPEGYVAPVESPSAKVFRLNSLAILQQAGGDYHGAAESFRAMVPAVEASLYWPGTDPPAVTPILYSICMLSIRARDAVTFHEYYPRLMAVIGPSPSGPRYVEYVRALTLESEVYLMTGEHDRALAMATQLEAALAGAESIVDLPALANAYILLVAVQFGVGDYSRGIEYLNDIFAMKAAGLPVHIYGIARIYQLMIHFERGDYDLLEHLLRSAHRFFVAAGSGYRSEKAIITFIKRALRTGATTDWAALFRDLRDEIFPLYDDPFESSLLHWIDLVAWLESKVSGRPYSDVRRERARLRAHSDINAPGASA